VLQRIALAFTLAPTASQLHVIAPPATTPVQSVPLTSTDPLPSPS
jgi:hypothetical protein